MQEEYLLSQLFRKGQFYLIYAAKNVYVEISSFDNFYNEDVKDPIIPIFAITGTEKSLNNSFIRVLFPKALKDGLIANGFTYSQSSIVGKCSIQLDEYIDIPNQSFGSTDYDVEYGINLLLSHTFTPNDVKHIRQDSIKNATDDIIKIIQNEKCRRSRDDSNN